MARGKQQGGHTHLCAYKVYDYASAHISYFIYKLSVCNLVYGVVSSSPLQLYGSPACLGLCSGPAASMMNRKSPG